jgi:HPt (histidine-containing phosphotransfer) domain-containing protein
MSKYIDQESGLKRVGGSAALYKKLLGKFIEGKYQEQLEALLAEGKIEDATGMAHTIKGVAANLSLTEVNQLALQVEQALKTGGDYASLVPQLHAATDATIEEINTL